MRKRFVVAFLCAGLIVAMPINGQGRDHSPAVEVFIGGAKLWQHSMGGTGHNHGPELAITGNFNRFLGPEMSVSKFQDSPPTAPAFGDSFSDRISLITAIRT